MGDAPREPRVVDGRVPPHDLDAEAAVLSAVMLDTVDMREEFRAPDRAIDVCVALGLRDVDFYSEGHKRICEAAYELHRVGQPTDVIQIGTWLKNRDRIGQVGGMEYLSEILNAAPAVTNVRHYVETVIEKARIRRLIATCQTIAAEGYLDYGGGKEFLEGAEARIHAIVHEHNRPGDGFSHIRDPLKLAVKSIMAASQNGHIAGIATGFERFDRITGGLHPGDLTIVAARPGMGKALHVDAKVLTPNGWRRMGDLCVDDLVVGSDGRPYPIVGVYDQGEKEVFRVVADDDGETICCDEHFWVTRTRSDRRTKRSGTKKTLREIRLTIDRSDGGANHSLPFVGPVEFATVGVRNISPWLLGVFLGDGSSDERRVRFSNPEVDIQDRIATSLPGADRLGHTDHKELFILNPSGSAMLKELRPLGLAGCRSWEKFIPREYLFAPIDDRIELLRGLLDSDGYITDAHRSVEYTTTSPRLRDDVAFLVGGLGGRVTWDAKATHYTKNGKRTPCREAYRMNISFPTGSFIPVSSKKHLAKYQHGTHRLTERFIKTVTPAGRAECRCIAVASPDHQFVTDDFLVTHNTGLVLEMLIVIGCREGEACLFESLEMPNEQLGLRAIATEGKIDLGKMRQGFMSPTDMGRMSRVTQEVGKSGVWTNDRPAATLAHLRADIRRARIAAERDGRRLRVVAVDYLQLMGNAAVKGRGQRTREQEVAENSKGLKEIAKSEGLAVVALSQLNRAVETRGEKSRRPQLSDLRESGSIEQDADNIIFIYRDEYYTKDQTTEPNIAELIVAKQRNGPTGTAKVRFDKEWVRFDNLAEGEYLDE